MEIHATSPSANVLTKSLMDQPSQKTVDHVKQAPQSSNEESNVDFRNMSRDDLKEWINDQLQAGNMTLEESVPFMLMTLNLDAQTLEPTKGSEPVNFMEMAKNVAEFHRSIGNNDSADALDRALEIMRKEQRGPLSITV
ncbi:hypothetical protein Q3O60_06030 [Alkalimonas collagenimarina]|uniref:Uncharacterized protein n=1 Tax=Alkalimonas collagenimarina TaxID=400390 RepID=A0ABT9GXJ0_9GAMM|nr:hypothetical protein [Alkalimonas collagenimarina]MDP4535738.1 hypothetical protein [Alkalimonas collagenimarina]